MVDPTDCTHGHPIEVFCPKCDRFADKKSTRLLRDALTALQDLGACEDIDCKEPNCNHAAANIRAYLQSWRVLRNN